MSTIKRALVGLPIAIFSMMLSCSEIATPDIDMNEVPVEDTETPNDQSSNNQTPDNTKDEIIDSLKNYIDSLTQKQEIDLDIIILNPEIRIKNGYIAEVDFRVNPSDAEVDLNSFQLDDITAHTKGVSYITKPANVKKLSVKLARNSNGSPLRGQYVMTIEDKGANSDYCEHLAIVYETKDAEGNKREISSGPFTVSTVPVSSLPKVYVNTPNGVGIKSKTEWVENSSIVIVDQNGNESLNATTSIRGRGNSTWGYPKKPYALKLSSKAEVLGMPKHKRWVLLANWMDRTLLRNDVAFEMGRRIMDWAPRGQFVELYLNGKHQGNYYLCEQIKPDKNRVNVDEENGGYILEFDTYGPSDEINYFYTPVKRYPVTIKEPDEDLITSWEHEGYLYISNHIGDFESLLESDKNDLSRWAEIESLIDVNSYIDWWLIHELTYNCEPHHPKSSYMHKKEDGKLIAGPVWDFDWGTFAESSGIIDNKTLWYGYFFKYQEFKQAVKARWAEVKEEMESMDSYIETQADYIEESSDVNIYKWPTTANTNGDEGMTFEKAIARMRRSLQLIL